MLLFEYGGRRWDDIFRPFWPWGCLQIESCHHKHQNNMNVFVSVQMQHFCCLPVYLRLCHRWQGWKMCLAIHWAFWAKFVLFYFGWLPEILTSSYVYFCVIKSRKKYILSTVSLENLWDSVGMQMLTTVIDWFFYNSDLMNLGKHQAVLFLIGRFLASLSHGHIYAEMWSSSALGMPVSMQGCW